MTILSLDAATKLTGCALFKEGELVSSGIIDLHKTKDSEARWCQMQHTICKLIKREQPDLVVIEGVQQQASAQTTITLAALQGAIKGFCSNHSIEYAVLAPSAWRSVLGFKQGKGVKRDELKRQSVDYVAMHFGKDVMDDEADAICLGAAIKLRRLKV